MLIPMIPMGRPIPPQDETTMPPQPRQTPWQKDGPIMIVVNLSRQPYNVSNSSREVARGRPISRTTPMNPIIEATFEHLEAGYECHQNRLDEHDARLKEHKERMAKKDGIMEKSNEIDESLNNMHCEHLGWTRATHEIAATSYLDGTGIM